MKILQICNEVLCDNEPHQELMGEKATWFCCKKGFAQSLKDFALTITESSVDEYGNLKKINNIN